jgi:hypothetical protein
LLSSGSRTVYTSDPAIPAAGSDWITGVRGSYFDFGRVEIPYPGADAVLGISHIHPSVNASFDEIVIGPVDIVTRGGLILVDIHAQVVWLTRGTSPTATNAELKADVLMDGVVIDSNGVVVFPCSTFYVFSPTGNTFDPKVRSAFTGLGMPQSPPAGTHRFEFRLKSDATVSQFDPADFQAQVVHARFVLTELLR